ncbi:hypothetical protein J6590_089600 [Homalodisca vitripennis]|nr:hypothetical protein J6590_089600 [Homalodisca vitripennis]
MPSAWAEAAEESEAKRPRVSVTPTKRQDCRRSIQSAGGLCWSSADLALAANLLETPNARFPTVTFANQEEKRRVFSLVYDVLRCDSINANAQLPNTYGDQRIVGLITPYTFSRIHSSILESSWFHTSTSHTKPLLSSSYRDTPMVLFSINTVMNTYKFTKNNPQELYELRWLAIRWQEILTHGPARLNHPPAGRMAE